jgi:hypothetical protein
MLVRLLSLVKKVSSGLITGWVAISGGYVRHPDCLRDLTFSHYANKASCQSKRLFALVVVNDFVFETAQVVTQLYRRIRFIFNRVRIHPQQKKI